MNPVWNASQTNCGHSLWILEKHREMGGLHEIHNDERIGGTLPDFRSKKVKLELTCQSPDQQSTRQTEFISFTLPQCLSVPAPPLTEAVQTPGSTDSRIIGTTSFYVCLSVEGKERVMERELRQGWRKKSPYTPSIPHTAAISHSNTHPHTPNTFSRLSSLPTVTSAVAFVALEMPQFNTHTPSYSIYSGKRKWVEIK